MYDVILKECNCLAQKLSNQSESVSKEVHTELLQHFARVEKHWISLEIALQKCKEPETKFDKPSVVRKSNAQRIPKPSVLEGLLKPVTAQTLPQTTRQAIVQLILFIVDSGCTKHMTGNLKLLRNSLVLERSQSPFSHIDSPSRIGSTSDNEPMHKLSLLLYWRPIGGPTDRPSWAGRPCHITFIEKFLGTVCFGNDQFAPILSYGNLVQGNITINRVYYVEGLNHNLFSVGQFCDADLEVAFRKSTCFVRDLQGNDLLTARDGENLDKMKEKRDLCILVGYSNQSNGYSVYNKRTRLIVESIHIRFDEIKEVSETSVANDTSGLVLQRQKASNYDNPDLIPQLQNVSSLVDAHVSSQQELDLLFGPLYDEFFNAGFNPQDKQPSTNV
nr:integrase, catalytic region, zinc finger, CCHC-type, peptidase aspartic, catalytic [Tanacetum cinerariifolium]